MKPAWSPMRSLDFRDAGPWLAPFLRVLNKFAGDVAGILGGGLMLQDNVRAQVDTLSFTTGATVTDSFPIDLDVRMGAMPAHGDTTHIVDLDNQDATFTSGPPSWRMNGDQIRVLFIPGLSANRRYQITLRWMP